MRKSHILMNNPVYLGLSILDLHKTVLYGFSYDYVEPEFAENNKLCYMDTNSFIVHVKTDDIYKDVAKDLKKKLTLQTMKYTDCCL